jgi:hypothetical protein
MHRARLNSVLGLIVALGLAAGFGLGAAQAQTAPAPAAETTEALLSVAMAGYTLVPVLGDDGTQTRDDQGPRPRAVCLGVMAMGNSALAKPHSTDALRPENWR